MYGFSPLVVKSVIVKTEIDTCVIDGYHKKKVRRNL